MLKQANNSATYGIGLRDKIGYALGDAAGVMLFSLIGSFLQMFYTDTLLISASKISLLFLITRIWDGINDPIWGAIIDHRKPGKNGKFRPYLRWASLPFALFGILLFVKIPGLTENQYLAWAYITYIGYDVFYTAVNIPYGSMASVITTDERERSALSMYRSIGSGLGGLPGQILLPLFVYSTVAETGEKALDGTKLLIGVLILALFSVITYQFSYKMTTERVASLPSEEKPRIAKTIKALIRNKPFIVLCFASMLLIAITQYTQTIYNYLFKDYFKHPEFYALVTVFTYLPMVLSLPFLQKIVFRFGKKEVCATGVALSGVANLILWILKTDSIPVFFLLSFVSGLGLGFFMLEVWALVTDVIDHQERLSGQRDEGTSYAFFSFTRKLGQTISAVLGAQVLVFIGYDAKNIASFDVTKMYSVATLIPAVACFIMALSLGLFYPLSKKKLKELNDNNQEEK